MPASSRRRLAPEARRLYIVEAARGLFAEQPYGAVTVSDIAEAAGVTRSLIHHYFGGVRDVYLAVIREGAGALTAMRTAGPGTPLEQRLSHNIAAALDVVEANRETWLAVVRGGEAADPEIRAISEMAVEVSVDRALRLNSDIVSDTPEARLALRCFHSFSTAATLAWITGEATREGVETLLVTALRDLLTRTIPEVGS